MKDAALVSGLRVVSPDFRPTSIQKASFEDISFLALTKLAIIRSNKPSLAKIIKRGRSVDLFQEDGVIVCFVHHLFSMSYYNINS